MRAIHIPVGGLWEIKGWTLYVDKPADKHDETCPHTRTRPNGDKIHSLVIVAKNEGGYNSTGVCALCVLEHLDDGKDDEVHSDTSCPERCPGA